MLVRHTYRKFGTAGVVVVMYYLVKCYFVILHWDLYSLSLHVSTFESNKKDQLKAGSGWCQLAFTILMNRTYFELIFNTSAR